MNLVEFQQLSKRTAPFNAQPENKIEFGAFLCNYPAGLVGEWFELKIAQANKDLEAVKKETGDVLHYAVNLLSVLGVEAVNNPSGNGETIYESLCNILEIPKKFAFHGHELEKEKLISSINNVINYVIFIIQGYGFQKANIPSILEANIEKLKERYKNGFSVEDSIARKDVQG